MQTIKVESIATTYGVAFSVKDGNFLASVGPDSYNPGRWATGNTTKEQFNRIASDFDTVTVKLW